MAADAGHFPKELGRGDGAHFEIVEQRPLFPEAAGQLVRGHGADGGQALHEQPVIVIGDDLAEIEDDGPDLGAVTEGFHPAGIGLVLGHDVADEPLLQERQGFPQQDRIRHVVGPVQLQQLFDEPGVLGALPGKAIVAAGLEVAFLSVEMEGGVTAQRPEDGGHPLRLRPLPDEIHQLVYDGQQRLVLLVDVLVVDAVFFLPRHLGHESAPLASRFEYIHGPMRPVGGTIQGTSRSIHGFLPRA